MKDDLNDLLRTWDPHVPEADSFRRDVWLRIGTHAREPRATGWFTKFLTFVAIPRMAAVAIAVGILAGGTAGMLLSESKGAENYLRSVNPYMQVR